TGMTTEAAQRSPGVLFVMTHLNAPRLPQGGKAAFEPPAGRMLSLLQDDMISYNGQPVAVVVADSFQHALAGAAQLRVAYERQGAALDFGAAKRGAYTPKKAGREEADVAWGDAAAGMGRAAFRVDHVYGTPMQTHNAMEPHATLAVWQGDQLTIHDSTQGISGARKTVAKTLGIEPGQVRVISPFVGGGFGSKGSVWSHVLLAAMAARAVRRPVKLALARPQMFGPVGGRPRTEQHVALGAAGDGRFTAIRHDVISHTSVMEDFVEPSAVQTRMLYATDNGATTHRLVKLNVGVPTFQRAPGEATGTFALESALDELSYALNMDPIELRLRNYAEKDPHDGKPFSSKSLRECYRIGAERFGWSRRPRRAGTLREGNELVGWGMATATYPANRMPASASAKILADGTAVVRSGTQDIGTGTYTVMAQVAAETLGLPVERVRFELGDSSMPDAPVSGGSMTVASVAPAVQAACQDARAKLVEAAIAAGGPLAGAAWEDVSTDNGWLTLRSDPSRRVSFARAVDGRGAIEGKGDTKPGDDAKQYSMHSFGAVFVEARVDRDLGRVRIPRVLGVYGVGRRLNAKTARSQLIGGIVWGLGMALMEETSLDPASGRIVNASLADYHVPVNADIGDIEVVFVDEEDPHVNPLGAKGIGEIGITGVSAAVANAVFHATGRRVRDLPVTLDKLLI
ncbi:MAG TPA: xanthine dehydrogenase family protein molybdopterin-binding subunit, partial [Burkholderiales bacterium]|nr:xanthine dehydrogenase family protein molybdopterin-binding subunit [Burkholderiales bacterium]